MSDSRPICSVCIANYNGIGLIESCIESVLAQDWDKGVEIIVHDDASSDGSVNLIRSRYPSVTLIESPHNVGFCIANNRMAQQADGEYLLLLNNDAALYPDALRTFLDETERLDRPAILGLPQYDAESGKLVDIGSLFDPFLNPIPNLSPLRGEVGMVIGACLWVPKALWEELGGFPEWFGSIAEDMYLCCCAHLAGYAVRAIPISGYRHWQGKSFGGGKITPSNHLVTTRRRRALTERNKSFVMLLTYPALWLILIFPVHLALLMLEGLVLVVVKRDSSLFRNIYFNCLKALWQERARIYQLRRGIQAKKKLSALEFGEVFRPMPHKLRMLMRHGWPTLA